MAAANVLADSLTDQPSKTLAAESPIRHTGLQEYASLARDTEHRLWIHAHPSFQQRTEPGGVRAGRNFEAHPIGQLHPDGRGVLRANQCSGRDLDEATLVVSAGISPFCWLRHSDSVAGGKSFVRQNSLTLWPLFSNMASHSALSAAVQFTLVLGFAVE